MMTQENISRLIQEFTGELNKDHHVIQQFKLVVKEPTNKQERVKSLKLNLDQSRLPIWRYTRKPSIVYPLS